MSILDGIGTTVRNTVERETRRALGVATSVGGIHVEWFSGHLVLQDLIIRNPDGFRGPHFLRIETLRVKLSPAVLLRGGRTTIPELEIEGLDLWLENDFGRTNYGAILDDARKARRRGHTTTARKEGRRFVVDELRMRRILARVRPVTGVSSGLDFEIPGVELREVGSEEGLSLAELAFVLVKALLEAVLRQGVPPRPTPFEFGRLQVELAESALRAATRVSDELERALADLGQAVEDRLRSLRG